MARHSGWVAGEPAVNKGRTYCCDPASGDALSGPFFQVTSDFNVDRGTAPGRGEPCEDWRFRYCLDEKVHLC